jgi:PleD family two-component response regulator
MKTNALPPTSQSIGEPPAMPPNVHGESLDVLLIEDNPGDVVLLRAMLAETTSPYLNLAHADTLSAALEMLDAFRFAAVITDLNLPDSTGIDTLNRLLAVGIDGPVIVLTHCDDDPVAIEMVKSGAQDYLVKGHSDGALIQKTVRYAIERKIADQHLTFLSHYDRLTGLANRELFQDRLEQSIYRADRNGNLVALLFLDVDRFKSINDTLGHKVGDELLCVIADRLKTCVRKVDTIARLGGDEFTIVLEDITSHFDARPVCGW